MTTYVKAELPGLSRMAVASLVFHLVLVAGFAFWTKVPPRRLFYAPVMSVRLVTPPATTGLKVTAKEEKPPVKVVEERKPEVKEAPAAKIKETKGEPLIKSSPKGVAEEKALTVAKSLEIKEAKEREAEQKRKEEIQELERQKQQWLAAQQERERRLLSKSMQSLKEPAPSRGVVQPAPPGTGASGPMRADMTDIRFRAYYNAVGEKVQSAWTLYTTPEGRSRFPNLTTIVSIRIKRDGTIAFVKVEESSRNSRFDEAALRAIAKAAPLPPLPSEYQGEYMELGFRFWPEGLK